MRLLILGPTGEQGSIPPYLNVLASALTRLGATVGRLGSHGVPYDPDHDALWPTHRLLRAAGELNDQLHTLLQTGSGVDLIALHHGNLEIEQLLPLLWAQEEAEPMRVPVVHHIHTLDPTLFGDHRPDPALGHALRTAPASAAGLVFFGAYAHTALARALPAIPPAVVSPLPTTIEPGASEAASPPLAAALDELTTSGQGPLVTLYGYAAPWKDPATLLQALERLTRPLRVLLAGPLWDDPEQAGIPLPGTTRVATLGPAHLRVLPAYLTPPDRAALTSASDAAVFCYQPHRAFQGSGAIADYLAAGVPVITADVANMAELAGHATAYPAGDLVPAGDPDALAAALDRYSDPHHLSVRTAAAQRRAHLFTPDSHARACLDLYNHVLELRQTRQL